MAWAKASTRVSARLEEGIRKVAKSVRIKTRVKIADIETKMRHRLLMAGLALHPNIGFGVGAWHLCLPGGTDQGKDGHHVREHKHELVGNGHPHSLQTHLEGISKAKD